MYDDYADLEYVGGHEGDYDVYADEDMDDAYAHGSESHEQMAYRHYA